MSTFTDSLHRPRQKALYRRAMASGRLLARPSGPTRAHSTGDNPDRVLVFGNGVASGWGALSHAEALPGQLAEALATRTGRGADVDVLADPAWSVENAADALVGVDLDAYDAIIVVMGVSDAFQLLPEQCWTVSLVRLLSELLKRSSSATGVTVMGIQPLSTIGVFDVEPGGVADRWAELLNSVTWAICEGRDRVHFVEPPSASSIREPAGSFGTAATHVDHFRSWAGVQATHLAPYLDVQSGEARPSRLARNRSQSRQRRLDTLWRLHLLDTPPEPRFDEIVERAQKMLGTQGAAFTVIGEDRQFNKATVGFPGGEIPLEQSFCATTITRSNAFVVGDAWNDDRVAVDGDVRFYAGYPVEAPDGTRIGALCVFGEEPRDPSTVDVALLRDLALAIQDELTHSVSVTPTTR